MGKTIKQPDVEQPDYEIGSGNVFADMGMTNPEERLLKSNLARMVNRTVKQRGWTQKHTAEVLGITQPKVSDMKRGLLDHFSVERLLNFLAKLDHRVTISVQDKTANLPSQEIVIGAEVLSGEAGG